MWEYVYTWYTYYVSSAYFCAMRMAHDLKEFLFQGQKEVRDTQDTAECKKNSRIYEYNGLGVWGWCELDPRGMAADTLGDVRCVTVALLSEHLTLSWPLVFCPVSGASQLIQALCKEVNSLQGHCSKEIGPQSADK